MVNDNAAGTSAEAGKLPPPPPKVVVPSAKPAPVAPQATGPDPQTPPVLQQVTGPNLPLPPPPPPPPLPPPQVTGPPAAVQPPKMDAPAAPETKAEASPPADDASPVAEKTVREYRYRTRILKAALLPILFSLMSFLMLNNYVTNYEPHYRYDFEYIAAGLIVGLVVTTGFLVANMRVARRDGTYLTRQKNSIVIILAFLVPYLYLMLFKSLELAWKFSIGYFFSMMVTPIVVMVYESYARGKFYVQEEELDDRLTRTLVFRA